MRLASPHLPHTFPVIDLEAEFVVGFDLGAGLDLEAAPAVEVYLEVEPVVGQEVDGQVVAFELELEDDRPDREGAWKVLLRHAEVVRSRCKRRPPRSAPPK